MIWEVAYNVTRRLWMVWRDGSPAIALCPVERDAIVIAALLNTAGIR